MLRKSLRQNDVRAMGLWSQLALNRRFGDSSGLGDDAFMMMVVIVMALLEGRRERRERTA